MRQWRDEPSAAALRFAGWSRRLYVAATGLALALIMAGGIYAFRHLNMDTQVTTLAVLPFADPSGDADDRFADGLTLEVIDQSAAELGGTDHVEAYELLLAANANMLPDYADVVAGLRQIDRALELDPEFALAWARKAMLQNLLDALLLVEFPDSEDRTLIMA